MKLFAFNQNLESKRPTLIANLASGLLLITLALSGCTATKPTLSREDELNNFKQAIRAKYDLKEQAFANNDPEPILNQFYANDAISTNAEGETYIGKDELRSVYEKVIGSFVRIESFNTVVNGDIGWDWVNFHVSFPVKANKDPITFKMLFLWERINGEWWSKGEMFVRGEFDIKGISD